MQPLKGLVWGCALAALVAGRGGQKALDALERTEAQLSAFGVHLPRRGARERT